jgi:hypothetical protein
MNRAVATLLLVLIAGGAVALAAKYLNPADPTTDPAESSDPAGSKGGTVKDRVGETAERQPENLGSKDVGKPVKSPVKKDPVVASPLGQKLGWSNADAEELQRWYKHVATTQQQHLDECDDGGGVEAGRAFNRVMAKHRQEAIEKFTVGRANQALGELAIYQFDLGSGSLFRVDAQGVKLPSYDASKIGTWSGFQKR